MLEIVAVTFESIWNTRLWLLPLTVTPFAGPLIWTFPLLSSSWPPVRVIVRGVLKSVWPVMGVVLNMIVSTVEVVGYVSVFALMIAWRSEPVPESLKLVTV